MSTLLLSPLLSFQGRHSSGVHGLRAPFYPYPLISGVLGQPSGLLPETKSAALEKLPRKRTSVIL